MNQHVYLTPLVSTASRSGFLYPRLLSALPPPPRDHRSFSGATLTCPGPSLCRGDKLPNGSHHLHPRRKRHLPWPALHYLSHLTRYPPITTITPLIPPTIVPLAAFPVHYKPLFCPSAQFFFCSWVFAHKQDAEHVV